MRSGTPILVACLVSGCAAPGRRPIDPAASERKFRARSLSADGLREYLQQHRGGEERSWPLRRWDLEALTLAAFYYSPDLEVARARLEGATARERTASRWPNPTVGVGLQKNLDIARGISPWTYAFDVSQPIETAGKRGYRMERAGHLGEAARLSLAETGWRVYRRVREALLEHRLALLRREVREAAAGEQSERVRLLEERWAAGAASRREVDETRRDAARARLAYLEARDGVSQSRGKLAAAIGVPERALDSIRFAPSSLEEPTPLARLDPSALRAAGLRDRLDLRRLVAEHSAAEAALQLEAAKRFPDLDVSPGFLREEGESKPALGVSVTLPLFDRNQGPIAEAEAERKEAAARYAARQAEAIAEIESALKRYRAALSSLAEADRFLDLSTGAERAVEAGVEVGERDILELTESKIRLLDSRAIRLAALGDAWQALGRLEDSVERPLGTGSSPLPAVPPAPPERSSRGSE